MAIMALSLGLGLGVWLIFLSLTAPAGPRPPATGSVLRRWCDALLRQAAAEELRPRDFLLLSLVAGGATGGATLAVLGWPLVALVAGLVGAALPAWYLRDRRARRRTERQAALADAVDALRASVRVGMSIEDALTSLAHHGPTPLRPALQELARDLRLTDFETAISRTRDRLADEVFDTIAAAVLLAHRLGGRNLGAVLDSLGQAVRGALQVEREVQAHQARNVLSARIIAALPLGLVFAIRGVNPDYLDPFATPTGQLVLAGCIVSVAVGYAAMLRTARLPVTRGRRP